jgi:hypothetical protein
VRRKSASWRRRGVKLLGSWQVVAVAVSFSLRSSRLTLSRQLARFRESAC